MANAQPLSLNNTVCETFLTRGQTVGLVITAESGLISAIAVLFLFKTIIRNIWQNVRNPLQAGWRFFRSPLDVYMLSLFISDLLQGLGGILDIKWIHTGVVQCSSYCTAQGLIQQLGETGVALATLAIAVHTFVIILFRRGQDAIVVASIVVCAIWLYVILFNAITGPMHNSQHFEAPTPYWCWMRSKFMPLQITGEYFWLWFTAITSLFLYIPLFFFLRGNIEREDDRWWRIRFRRRPQARLPVDADTASARSDSSLSMDRRQDSKGAAQQAFSMLLYPVSYVVLVLPLSIVRWIDFGVDSDPPDPNNIHEKMPSAATFVVVSLFGLSGLVNVTLLFLTRPGLLNLNQAAQGPALGPAFGSSESVELSTMQSGPARLRPSGNPMLNMGDDLGSQSQSAREAGEA